MVTETFKPDNLVQGAIVEAISHDVAASQTIKRGNLVTISSGVVSAYDSTVQGAFIYGIAADDVTTTATDTGKTLAVYLFGVFNKATVEAAENATLSAAQLLELRNIGIALV